MPAWSQVRRVLCTVHWGRNSRAWSLFSRISIPKRSPSTLPKRILLLFSTTTQLIDLCFSHPHIQMIMSGKEALFFNIRDGPFMPSLRMLHKCHISSKSTTFFETFLHFRSQPPPESTSWSRCHSFCYVWCQHHVPRLNIEGCPYGRRAWSWDPRGKLFSHSVCLF